MIHIAALDIEIVDDLPESGNWREGPTPRISAVGVYLTEDDRYLEYYDPSPDGLVPDTAIAVMRRLYQLAYQAGYWLVTHNGMGFDLPILHHWTASNTIGQRYLEKIAMHKHIDMMLSLVCCLGHPLGLNTLANALGVPGKAAGMTGADAPHTWREGRYDEVLAYLRQDCIATANTCLKFIEQGYIPHWVTSKGTQSKGGAYPYLCHTPDGSRRLLTPAELEHLPDVRPPNWPGFIPFNRGPLYSWLTR